MAWTSYLSVDMLKHGYQTDPLSLIGQCLLARSRSHDTLGHRLPHRPILKSATRASGQTYHCICCKICNCIGHVQDSYPKKCDKGIGLQTRFLMCSQAAVPVAFSPRLQKEELQGGAEQNRCVRHLRSVPFRVVRKSEINAKRTEQLAASGQAVHAP